MIYLLIPGAYLVMSPLFTNVFATPKMLVVAIGLVGLWWGGERKRVAVPFCWLPITALLGVSAVSAFFAVDPWMALVGHFRAPYYGLLELVMVALAYWWASNSLGHDDLLPLAAGTGAVLGAFAYLQVAAGHSFIGRSMPSVDWPWSWYRAIGLIGNPVFLGAALVPCFTASWYMTRRGFGYDRMVSVLMLAGCTVGIVAAQAKGAVLSCAAALIVLESPWSRYRWRLVGLYGLMWAYLLIVPGQNNSERLALMGISWRSFLDYPWLGWGPDNFALAFRAHRSLAYIHTMGGTLLGQASAHQDLAQVAATTGLLGLAAYVWTLLSVASRAQRLPMAILAGLWFQAQVNPIPTEVMVVAALLIGAASFQGSWTVPVGVPRALSLASLVLVVYLARADHIALRGVFRPEFLIEASRITPEAEVSVQAVDALLNAAARAPIGLAKKQAEVAMTISDRAVRNHPRNAYAWDALSRSIIVRIAVSRQPNVKALMRSYWALCRAVALDPTFEPLLVRKINMGKMVGDTAGVKASEKVYREVQSIKRGSRA